MTQLRPDLPPVTERIAKLPIDERGYPVPFFVQWLTPEGEAAKRGVGKPDFRMMDYTAFADCVMNGKCWICGQPMGRIGVFVIGPMCAINRNTAKPPSHQDCARWAVRACPFLLNPNMVRNEHNMPSHQEAPGISIRRNPGVMVLWSSRTWKPYMAHNGMLITVGEPLQVEWWSRGRLATRQEVIDAIDSGVPLLEKECANPSELDMLHRMRAQADKLLPAA